MTMATTTRTPIVRAPHKLSPLVWCAAWLLLSAVLVIWALGAFYDVPLSPNALRFERPWAGLVGLLIPLVLWVRGYRDRQHATRIRFSRGADLRAVPAGKRVALRPLLTALRVSALSLLTLGLMGPQSIHARNKTELEGIDMVLTLDLSLSMQASDITPNRFEATKFVVDDFVARRPNDRIGAVVFGRDAYTLLPLTTDKDMLRGAIADLELGLIEGRGTAIGNAVGVALNRLRNSKAKSKVIILLTDGDSNSGNIAPDEAADFAKHMGVKLYTILMGQSEDARVQQGVDLFGRPLFGQGNFPVNPVLLQRMATSTGGEAFLATDRDGLERSFHSILDRLKKSEIEDAGAVYGELFPAFVGLAVLWLMFEALLASTWLRRWP
jgi:Ca-activated chloride channel homolog